MSLFTLKVHELCNEGCIFCFQDHHSRWHKKILQPKDACTIMYIAYKKWYTSINFSWWEPLIHPHIITFIAFAKKIGFEVIGVHTNAVRFSERKFLMQCIAAWMNNVNISIHHSDTRINDMIVCRDWATQQSLQAIDLLHGLWVYTVIYIVLNQLNYRDIYSIVADFFSRWILHMVIMFPTIQWSMRDSVDSAMVSYNEVIPFLKEVLWMLSWAKWRYLYLFNIPACLVPEYEEYVMTATDGVLYELDGKTIDYYDQKTNTNHYISVCSTCTFREKCAWLDTPYVEKYGSTSFAELVHPNSSSIVQWIGNKKLLDSLFTTSIRTQNDIIHLLKIIISPVLAIHMAIPITGYSIKTDLEYRSGIVLDMYHHLSKLDNPFHLSTSIHFFHGLYRHIEFSISNQNKEMYKYILWFDTDHRYEIAHYIFSSFPLSVHRSTDLLAIFQLFDARSNLFHLGVDPSNQRIKLYISLYDDDMDTATEIVAKLYRILWVMSHIEKDLHFRKYDCIGIDIMEDRLEMKVYELLHPISYIPREDHIQDWNIKEFGYMKSTNSRKKMFYRLTQYQDLDRYSKDFAYEGILAKIHMDSWWVLALQEKVKYYCIEWDKKELYFI